jgi:hypothetical protein
MLKTQRFASLFRHYAKHHGLDKETLVFYFTEELQNEDTPESVHMQVVPCAIMPYSTMRAAIQGLPWIKLCGAYLFTAEER